VTRRPVVTKKKTKEEKVGQWRSIMFPCKNHTALILLTKQDDIITFIILAFS
jgi:hypothetical protein